MGTASAATNIAAIAPKTASRAEPSFGSISFVSQAYAPQANQRAERISSPRPIPPQVGSSDMKPVTCVRAKTKTRSKKSSSGVTGCSDSSSPSSSGSISRGASASMRG